MGRIANAILKGGWDQVERVQTELEAQQRHPDYDHFTEHCYAAYEYYGHPFYCATIGDTMGNVIRREALRREWIRESLYSEDHPKTFHDVLGIGLHNQHVIDYNTRYAARGQLLDLTYYCQVYSVPRHPKADELDVYPLPLTAKMRSLGE